MFPLARTSCRPSGRSALPRHARRSLGLPLLLAFAAFAGCDATGADKSAAPQAARGPRQAPVDPRTRGARSAITDPGQFAADLFLSLNWPAAPGSRGAPDGSGHLGQTGATVWETFKNTSEIYLPGGATPAPWTTVSELPAGITPPSLQQLQQQFGVTNSPWLHFFPTSESRMVDGQQVVDANTAVIRYDIRANQDHFNYIVSNPAGYPLFNFEGQQQALNDANFTFSFPTSALEVKAAWRILGPTDDDRRYWTAYGAFLDSKQNIVYAKVGLTAFHIISRIFPGWIWLTYEQVDNPTATFGFFLGAKQNPLGPNPTINPQAATFNQQLQPQTKGTKWQFYQIIGWQTAETTQAGAPVVLANMNIESYFPQTSSCKSCHAMANIGPPAMPRLNFWDTTGGSVTGRVGPVDFPAIAQQLAPGLAFKQLDFVWSLRQAQSTQAAAKK
ncbi:MAG: hypothetical protein HZA93_09765 [Verrucomicrobia bacterium]|nr:hypothetical protein [Verrucomicrobiota bacterium]